MNTPLRHRVLAGFAVLLLSGCGSDAPPRDFPPLSFTYLTPLRINVGSIETDDHWLPTGSEPDISTLSPVQPVNALVQMAQDRLIAVGSGGKAIFRIEDAGINRIGDQLQGHFGVELDIYTSDNTRTAYAEARVARASIIPDSGIEALRGALYDLTKLMMADMNVEFEYQLRHSLHDWIQDGTDTGPAVPAPVIQQPLSGSPGTAPATPAAPPAGPQPGVLGTLPQSLLPPEPPGAPPPQ